MLKKEQAIAIIVATTKDLKDLGHSPFDGFDVNVLHVHHELERAHPEVIAWIRRYHRGIDPYQVLKRWVPRHSK